MQLLKRGAITAPAGQQAKALLNRARGLLRMELEPTRKNLHINFLAGLNAQVCQKVLAQGQLALAGHRQACCGQNIPNGTVSA
jgi:hypothetical protein